MQLQARVLLTQPCILFAQHSLTYTTLGLNRMDEFIAWLWDASYWHWWAFAVALIGIEAIAPSTFLIWPAVSAVAVGFALAIDPEIDWRYQILAFALLSMISNLGWFFWLKRHPSKSDRPALNWRRHRSW